MNITLYMVLENNKPCLGSNFSISDRAGWNKCVYCTELEARGYLAMWLNWIKFETMIAREVEEITKNIKVNVPYDYNGFGDMVEIRSMLITLGGF